jgi:hypothetical protein
MKHRCGCFGYRAKDQALKNGYAHKGNEEVEDHEQGCENGENRACLRATTWRRKTGPVCRVFSRLLLGLIVLGSHEFGEPISLSLLTHAQHRRR